MILLRTVIVCLGLAAGVSRARADETVNAVVGDASWTAHHGTPPADASSEERIRVHLEYVEGLLRAHPSAGLAPAQRERRESALDALAAYRRTGIFPRRSGDPYPGRRPRFIDDRGVHCAVGQLIATSGHPALARAIDARFEYAYVRDIDEPRLDSWAEAHGFTRRELAMIQPGYSPVPDADNVRAAVEDVQESITLHCARKHEPPASLRLRIRGDDDGQVTFGSIDRGGFVRCFLERLDARRVGDVGAADEAPRSFRSRMRVTVEAPQAILQRRLDAIPFDADSRGCRGMGPPYPGRVFVLARVGDEGPRVWLRTEPANREVSRCLRARVEQQLAAGGFEAGAWRLSARRQEPLDRHLSDARLASWVQSWSGNFGTECWVEGAPARPTVRARVSFGDEAIEVNVAEGPPGFRSCLAEKLAEQLQMNFGWGRELPDGSVESYFRSDGDATASHAFDLESPADREARIQRQQEEFDRQMQRNRD